MTEREITICGHGSGVPTCKNLETYLQQRWEQKADNGVRKGLVCVRRVTGMTDTDRQQWKDAYTEILGRNIYSQQFREYVFKPYKGWYYSDCSSSGDACFAKAGHNIGWLNTAGQYINLSPVPVVIKDGHITNPEILKIGDCLLFAGNDSTRPLQIGHVEYIYDLPDSWHWVKEGDKWYYQDQEGRNTYGWKKIKETTSDKVHWYYFNNEGQMVKGLQYINNNMCVFMPNGDLEGALCKSDDNGYQHVWDVI